MDSVLLVVTDVIHREDVVRRTRPADLDAVPVIEVDEIALEDIVSPPLTADLDVVAAAGADDRIRDRGARDRAATETPSPVLPIWTL